MKKLAVVPKLLVILLAAALLIYSAVIDIARHEVDEYTVRGVDVSAYQGDIDWDVLADSGISFAYVKATEGSRYVDRFAEKNILGAADAGLYVGAYHFMSYESSGREQARNFIAVVPKREDMLPPAVDVEFYGEYEKSPASAEHVWQILDELLYELEAHYGKKPVIYANRRSYSLYISGRYEGYDIWFCDLAKKPSLPDGRGWTFWQYSHTEKLPGYDGEEEHIDMNVYIGSPEELSRYAKHGKQ